MLELFIETAGKKLRCGYTTGSSATAAAKAATIALFNNKIVENVLIETPKGIDLIIDTKINEKKENFAIATVIKDGGDDVDITNGIEILAKAEKIEDGFTLEAGVGIGYVTEDGLSVKKGEFAINPVPREMIKKEVLEVLPKDKGVKITISVPKGEEIAKKTFNPRLGILGGISILGTTGIVYPMSTEALKETIAIELNQKAKNHKKIIFAFGNIGEVLCENLKINDNNIVIISNFVGFAIDEALAKNVEEIILVGHIGKISKVAFGCFNTHSKVSDVRLEVIALELALMGESIDLINNILKLKTSEAAVNFLGEGFEDLYERIGIKVLDKLNQRGYEKIKFNIIMYSGYKDYNILYDSRR
ncbi:MAG: cobalt-precorrin-5B (C(1))-methyltransferase CbiD [Sarcina sp.]